VARGRRVFLTHCSACHGPEGRGDGPAAAGLNPPPADFHVGPRKHGTSREAIRKVIVEGVRGTAMPSASAAIPPADLDAVAAFVASIAPTSSAPAELPEAMRALLERAGFTPVAVPRGAPAFDLRSADAGSLSLPGLRGKWVLLNFWGATCATELPELERLADDLRDRGLVVVCVCADEDDARSAHDAARGHVERLPVYADLVGTSQLRYDVQALPTTWLIDPRGRLVGKAEGAREWSAESLGALLESGPAAP
jgi:peroxiredoxin